MEKINATPLTLEEERQNLIEELAQYSGWDEKYGKIMERIKEIDILMLPIQERATIERQQALFEKSEKEMKECLDELRHAVNRVDPKPKHWWQDEMLFKWVRLGTVETTLPAVALLVWASLESDGTIRMKLANLIYRLFKISI